ncbi:MAG: TetR/AcrR family transcriptional regulator [Myxococcales bacterium]|nr:TetR/AcrR family transcriptional regulator [Myxococcales bacterium]
MDDTHSGERPGKPGGKRDQNRREKIALLCDAALPLFLERGIERVTIDDITQQAAIAKGSFYRYFPDKTALVATLMAPLDEVIHDAMDRCAVALRTVSSRGSLLGAYSELGAQIAGVIFRYPDVVRLYLQECRSPMTGARAPVRKLADMITNRAIQLTATAISHGLLRPFEPSVSALAVVGASEQLLFTYLSGNLNANPAAVPAQLASLVLEGLRGSAEIDK